MKILTAFNFHWFASSVKIEKINNRWNFLVLQYFPISFWYCVKRHDNVVLTYPYLLLVFCQTPWRRAGLCSSRWPGSICPSGGRTPSPVTGPALTETGWRLRPLLLCNHETHYSTNPSMHSCFIWRYVHSCHFLKSYIYIIKTVKLCKFTKLCESYFTYRCIGSRRTALSHLVWLEVRPATAICKVVQWNTPKHGQGCGKCALVHI